MNKILTPIFAFILSATWSFGQCTIGTTPGSSCTFFTDGTITIPAGIGLSLEVKAYSAGGGSTGGTAANQRRSGGGGGAYFDGMYTVSGGDAGGPGNTISIVVGQGGLSHGGNTTFDFGSGLVTLLGGRRGHTTGPGAGGTGGTMDGGAGGTRSGSGGGGGGGAGPMNSAGVDGVGAAGGAGGNGTGGAMDPIDASDGGAGGANGEDASPGIFPGGGAGGKGTNGESAAGASGRVIVTVLEALPIELVSFNANVKDNQTILEWQTASEVNNEGFEIQKSKDGKIWDMIEFVKGQGTASGLNTYTAIDKSPTAGSNYYRLKQMDFDGKFEYSEIVVVDFNKRLNEIGLFPNPAKNQLTLINGEGQVIIYNVLGETVKQLTIDANQTTIPLADLLDGQYYLQVIQEDGFVVSKQFTKIK